MQTLLPALAALTFVATTVAQTSLTLPAEYDRAWGRGSTSALGGNSTRTQMVFANPFPVGTTVLGVGLRPTTSTIDRASFTADIEIRLSSSPMVPGALSSTFANNVGSDEAVVLAQQTVTIPAMPANRGTGQFATFNFPTPFVFGTNGNTNLVVELKVFSRSAGASWSTDRAFAATNGRAANAGIGCGTGTVGSTSTGGTYVSGSTVNVTLANAPATTIALLVPSLDMKEFVPGVPLPFPLAAIGAAPGCDLLVNPEVGALAFVTDPAGAAAWPFTIPLTFSRSGLGVQWVYFVTPTATNPAGLETTANRAIWIGPEVVVPSAQYVWDLSNVAAVTGNSTTDSVPVVQFLIQ